MSAGEGLGDCRGSLATKSAVGVASQRRWVAEELPAVESDEFLRRKRN